MYWLAVKYKFGSLLRRNFAVLQEIRSCLAIFARNYPFSVRILGTHHYRIAFLHEIFSPTKHISVRFLAKIEQISHNLA